MGGVEVEGFEFQTIVGLSIIGGGGSEERGECTGIYLAPDYDLDITEPGLDDGAELRLVAHNLVVAVLNQLAGTVVPVSRQCREGLELVAPERHHILAAVGAAAGRLFMGVVLFYESGRATRSV